MDQQLPLPASEQALNELVAQFFDLFTNAGGRQPQVWEIHSLFIPQGVIIKKAGEISRASNRDSVYKSGVDVLSESTLTDFLMSSAENNSLPK